MSKKGSPNRPEVQVREAMPRYRESKTEAQILCPFCEPPHSLSIGAESPCGTMLKVTAVQTIVPTRTVHKHGLVCVKCKKGGGMMVKYHSGYVHLHECTPNTKLMTEPPEFSRMAAFVFGLPEAMRNPMEKMLGKAKQVKEVDPRGVDTGKVLGYFFYRSTPARNHPSQGE